MLRTTHGSRVLLLIVGGVLAACTAAASPDAPATGTSAVGNTTVESARAPVASASASAPPTAAPRSGTVAGVTFTVPDGWTLVNEGELSVAKSPDGNAGFVFAGFDDVVDIPKGLHRAEAESKTTFSSEFKSLKKQLPLGSLPFGFVFAQAEKKEGDRLVRSTTLSGANAERKPIALYAWVSLPIADAEGEGRRMGLLFDGIFKTFALAK